MSTYQSLLSIVTILHTRSFWMTILSLPSHVRQSLIIYIRDGAVKPSHVGQSPLSCKSALFQSR